MSKAVHKGYARLLGDDEAEDGAPVRNGHAASIPLVDIIHRPRLDFESPVDEVRKPWWWMV